MMVENKVLVCEVCGEHFFPELLQSHWDLCEKHREKVSMFIDRLKIAERTTKPEGEVSK